MQVSESAASALRIIITCFTVSEREKKKPRCDKLANRAHEKFRFFEFDKCIMSSHEKRYVGWENDIIFVKKCCDIGKFVIIAYLFSSLCLHTTNMGLNCFIAERHFHPNLVLGRRLGYFLLLFLLLSIEL